MKYTRVIAFAILAGVAIVSTGRAVERGQETVGAYMDDATITTSIKAKFVEDKTVDAGAMNVKRLMARCRCPVLQNRMPKRPRPNTSRETRRVFTRYSTPHRAALKRSGAPRGS